MSEPKIRTQPDERFSDWSMDTLQRLGPAPQCSRCIHRHGITQFCDAFPDGIPAIILRGDFDHTEPFPGDNGIRFEPEDSQSKKTV